MSEAQERKERLLPRGPYLVRIAALLNTSDPTGIGAALDELKLAEDALEKLRRLLYSVGVDLEGPLNKLTRAEADAARALRRLKKEGHDDARTHP